MASEQSPLLGTGQDREHGQGRQQIESAVTGSSDGKPAKRSRFRNAGLLLLGLVTTAVVIVGAVWIQHNNQTSRRDNGRVPGGDTRASKRNLIFMVSDGMGPASLALTRGYRQLVESLPMDDVLTLDKHFWGTSRTRSSSSLVTDSAAGATAFSCGKKSYNGAISTLPNFEPCGSVMEAAKKAGYTTGLVVTTDITDATPACFASHVLLRQMQDEIALQEIGQGHLGRSVDLMLGGGRCHFLPNGTDGSCRLDDVDVVRIAQEEHGWSYIDSRKGFDALKGGNNTELPLLGLFASTDVPFEIDRKHMTDVYPSLSEMATTALRALEKAAADSDKGFFLMIEGSRIDHAGHFNDPAAQVREVLEYDKTFKAVLDFIDESDVEGVLVATSDHETGGLATAIQEPGHLPVYNWYPQALAGANASCEILAATLRSHIQSPSGASTPKNKLKAWINEELVIPGLGVRDATDDELSRLVANADNAVETFAAIISLRAHVGWSTHGHTAVDVNIYSSGGPLADSIRGNVENTGVGEYLSAYLDVDVDEITKELQRLSKDDPAERAMKMHAMQESEKFDAYHNL